MASVMTTLGWPPQSAAEANRARSCVPIESNGIVALSDDELELMRSKVVRFVSIFEAAGSV